MDIECQQYPPRNAILPLPNTSQEAAVWRKVVIVNIVDTATSVQPSVPPDRSLLQGRFDRAVSVHLV
jgi:hypothetical protein